MMTYARSRLLLGISGVGSIVVVSVAMLVTQLPLRLLPTSHSWSVNDLQGLLALFVGLICVLLPVDFLGGYLLPNRWRPNTIGIKQFLGGLFRGVAVQGLLFIAASLLLLGAGRAFGFVGASAAVALLALFLIAFQLPVAKLIGNLPTRVSDKMAVQEQGNLSQAVKLVSQWGWKSRPIVVAEHHDTGFTGGIVGLPRMESIVLPAASLTQLNPDQLAVTIARRLEAIQGGSRTRGLLLAVLWVLIGFSLSSIVPGAGVASVAELAMTCFGFTLWTFLGLLTLPTLSRQASYAIDGRVLKCGANTESLQGALKTLDTLQDNEPRRARWIEAIFHPVPSVENRSLENTAVHPIAWHAARITLFVSWACMGMLVRAVHCNVGRPELWVMLPTD